MPSIYAQTLGTDFQRLHPVMQRRLGLHSAKAEGFIGRGVMERISNAGLLVRPFLWLGTLRRILFPERGQQIPFIIENYAYQDPLGRETVAWLRTFRFPHQDRHFDATMVYDAQRRVIVDYLGTHQHLAVDCHFAVTPTGGFTLKATQQRVYERRLAFRLPALLTGVAHVSEEYEEATGLFHIQVRVTNVLLGTIFQYKGSFRGEFVPVQADSIPTHAYPLRYEPRL